MLLPPHADPSQAQANDREADDQAMYRPPVGVQPYSGASLNGGAINGATVDGASVNESTLQAEIDALAPWFHNLHLPNGMQTAPQHWLGDFPNFKWQQLAPHLPADLSGWRVLDIGCNSGFYTLQLAQRGATVVGVDVDPHYLRQAAWAVQQFGLTDRVELRQAQVYDLAHWQESFDLVLFMGVFYHLRYPLLGLDIVAQKVRRLLVFQTVILPGEEVYPAPYNLEIHQREPLLETGWPKLAFVEHRFSGDPTNWWIANRAGVEALLRSAGLRVEAKLEQESYLCTPDPEHPSSVTTWNATEYQAAVGLAQVHHRL